MADARTIKIPDANGNLVSYPIKDAINKRARRDITSEVTSNPTKLTTAIAEQNLEKYGFIVGNEFHGASGYRYVLADPDTYYGGYNNNAVVNTHHYGIVVITGITSAWGETTNGYDGSTLQSVLENTVLNNIKSDLKAIFGGSTGLEHLIPHSKLFTTNASTGWGWKTNKYISALTEMQVFNGNVWSMNEYQNGEAVRGLELFRKFRFNEIFGNVWVWLRNLFSAAAACDARNGGCADTTSVSNAHTVVGLILFY